MIKLNIVLVIAALVNLSISINAHAGPNDYMRLPIVEYGEREIDIKSGIQKNQDGSTQSAHSIGYGFTPSNSWFTEFYVNYAKQAGESTSFDAWEWENRLQLTELGQYPVDVGLLFELERPKDRSQGYEIKYGPMFQTEWGLVQGNFNIFVQQHIQATESTDTELLYQLQFKYRNSEALEWGLQGFGNVGKWNSWNSSQTQELKIGPALFGKIRVGNKESIKWNFGVLYGVTDVSPKTNMRLQTEYEF